MQSRNELGVGAVATTKGQSQHQQQTTTKAAELLEIAERDTKAQQPTTTKAAELLEIAERDTKAQQGRASRAVTLIIKISCRSSFPNDNDFLTFKKSVTNKMLSRQEMSSTTKTRTTRVPTATTVTAPTPPSAGFHFGK
jgi:hypothetical protein